MDLFDFDKVAEIFDLFFQSFVYGWQLYLGILIFVVFNMLMCVIRSIFFKDGEDENK